MPVRRASCKATGMKIASAPMFLLTTDSAAVMPTRTGTCACSVLRRGRRGRITFSTTPERAIAALIRRAEAMMTTTSSEKPSNAFAAGTMPVATPARSASSATRS